MVRIDRHRYTNKRKAALNKARSKWHNMSHKARAAAMPRRKHHRKK